MLDRPCQYRSTKPVPFGLNERIRCALEETLYPQAIECLGGVIIPGVSTPTSPPAALVPPHTHIRLITTLVSHPYLTTQLSKNEPTPTAPTDAFILLRRILKLIGPLNSDFAAAWMFEDNRIRGRARAKKERERDSPNYTTDDHLASDLAMGESLFFMAEDVWAIVGWGFTCSVLHPERWRWWKLELEILLDVLETDWEDRQRSCRQSRNHNALKQALVVRMLPDTNGSAGYKRVIRAILASGTGTNLVRWNPIYKDELLTKRPKKENMGSLNNNFISDDDEDEPQPAHTPACKPPSEDIEMTGSSSDEEGEEPGVAGEWGGMEALVLRQRFLSLLSSVSYHDCYIDIEDLYREYNDTILRFSLPSFVLFTATFLFAEPSYRAALNQLILDTIISPKAPGPKKDETDDLTPEKLIYRYLPWPANTTSISDNAKVAVLLDNMLRLLVTEAGTGWSLDLESAVWKGIDERRKKVVRDKRMNMEKEEARAIWEGAEERLSAMVTLLKMRLNK